MSASGRVRVELWDDLPAAGGSRLTFVSGSQAVVSVTTPETLDFTGQATLVLVPTPALIAALAAHDEPVWRLVPFAADGTAGAASHWRGLAWELAADAGVSTLTVTAVHPILDWGKAGRCRATNAGGVTTFTMSGDYTPTQALAVAFDRLADVDRGYWQPGPIDRTDTKRIEIVSQDPLAVAHAVAQLWESELEYGVSSDELTHTVGLRSRVAATAAIPLLRYDGAAGALLAYTRRQDATEIAHVVTPIGADGATMARAAWRVDAVNAGTGWIDLADPSGGYGPVQIDGQYADGAALRATDGTLHPILDSLANDRWTSRVQVASTTGFSVTTPRQHVEIAADSAGTLLIAVADPDVPVAQQVEVTRERSDLTADRNLMPNPRGATYTGSLPAGWALSGTGTLTRGTPPAGCPIGDDGTGQMWKASLLSGDTLRLTQTPVLDGPNGDDQLALAAWVYLVPGSPGDDLLAVPEGSGLVGGSMHGVGWADGGQWIRIDGAAALAPTPAAVRIRFAPEVGGTVQFWIAAGMIQRGAGSPAWIEYDRPAVNLLVQAANAHLLAHRVAPRTFPSARVDETRLSVPLTTGGDVRVIDPALQIDSRARLSGRPLTRHAPTPSDLTLVEAPDPAIAAQTGAASPGRTRSLLERLVADIQSG